MTTVSSLHATPLTPHGNQAASGGPHLWGGDGPGFDDALDLVNPLQHLPGVSSLYRSATGDRVSAGVRMIGGAALGGLPGLAMSAAGALFEAVSGQDPGEAALSLLQGETPTLFQSGPDAAELFQKTDAAPLTADAGEALLAIAVAQVNAARDAGAAQEEQGGAPFLDLGPFRAPAASVRNESRHARLRADMDETALNMAWAED